MDDPVALVSGGTGLAYLAGEIENGIACVDRAIVLNPNLAFAWSVSGWGRVYLGEHADAIVRLERAIRLSPRDLLAYHIYTGMGWANLFSHRYDEAVSWARKAALEEPEWAVTARLEAIACALSGRIVEAQEALARMRAIDPNVRVKPACHSPRDECPLPSPMPQQSAHEPAWTRGCRRFGDISLPEAVECSLLASPTS